MVTAIFSAIICWNEFIFTLILITDDSKKKLTISVVGLTERQDIHSYGMLMAAAVIGTLPMLTFFMLIQRKLVVGLTSGALKG